MEEELGLYLQGILQVYMQLTTLLNRDFYINLLCKLA
jgi:hypothetical protein